MKLMLQKRIDGLGEVGDVVDVSDGYGRNYLLPQRMAVANTAANRRQIETDKLVAVQQEHERQALAEVVAKNLKNARLQVFMKAKDDGGLYGAVNSAVVAEVVKSSKGFAIEERWVDLETPIKKIGDYDITLRLPGEQACVFKLTVLPEEG